MGMRALKQRLMECAGAAGLGAWSDCLKDELLELARVGGGGSFKRTWRGKDGVMRRGDFFAYWKNRITNKPSTVALALKRAADYGLENRCQPGSWFLAYAVPIVDAKGDQ